MGRKVVPLTSGTKKDPEGARYRDRAWLLGDVSLVISLLFSLEVYQPCNGWLTYLSFSDFADEFPNAEVIGTDVSPMQPTWVPPNVKFELEDCNEEWTWPENTFDFVNMRYLAGVVTDWHALMRNAYRVAKPGAWVESYVPSSHNLSDDGSVKKGSPLDQWGIVFREGSKKLGRTFTVYEDDLQRKSMEAAGLVDIEFRDKRVPLGVWHPDKKEAEIGLWFKLTIEADIDGKLPREPLRSPLFCNQVNADNSL